MKRLCLWFLLMAVCGAAQAQKLPKVGFVDWQPDERVDFVRIAQFQIDIPYRLDSTTQLPLIQNPTDHMARMDRCLDIAAANQVQVLVFPELAMALEEPLRKQMEERLLRFCSRQQAIVVAGTYYDQHRRGCCTTVLPDGIRRSYKLRPSIFEASVRSDQGMVGADSLYVFRTRYGNFMTLVCVDMISDDANYMARYLSNSGQIEMLFNIQYNPAPCEFLREASSMTKRHPLFVVLANVASEGYSGLAGSVQAAQKANLLPLLPARFKDQSGALTDGYDGLIATLDPRHQQALIYDLNLRVIRVPLNTNAPDQGYPTVRNLKKIDLK